MGFWLLTPTSIERLLSAAPDSATQEVARALLLEPPLRLNGRYRIVPDARVFRTLELVVAGHPSDGRWLERVAGPPERESDALALAMQASPDMRTALRLACRYAAFWSTGTELRLDEEKGRVTVVTASSEASVGSDIAMAVTLALLSRRLSLAGAEGGSVVRGARLRWNSADQTLDVQGAFGVPVEVGAPDNALLLDVDRLNSPLPRAWQPFARFFEREVAETVDELDIQPQMRTRVQRVVIEELPLGTDGLLDRVSRSLGMSTRTLQRRLALEGTSYRELFGALRLELAQQALTSPSHSIGEVALALGFQDPSAFVRAFRVWTGVTPGAWRSQRGL